MPSNSQVNSFGYRLHDNESRGAPVPLADVPQIPTDADQWIKYDSEADLSPDLEEQCNRQIAAAKKLLFDRHIEQLQSSSYGRNSRFAHDAEADEYTEEELD